jgi:hypothetical protein
MRWATKRRPLDGQFRLRSRFLWAPKTIEGETRWLEFADWWERYSYTDTDWDTGPSYGWTVVRWA